MPPLQKPTYKGSLSGQRAYSMLPLRKTKPELLLFHGNIITINDEQPRAQALAIAGDRILAVGMDDDVLNLAESGTRKVDLRGKTVVPGFIDAHTHLSYSGLRHLKQLDCDLRSIEAIKDAVHRYVARKPVGAWVVGFKYDDTKTVDGRPLTRKDLDEASPNNPAFIEHRGGHTAYVNSLALRKVRVDEETADPPGGHFERDSTTGRLTGKLEETAMAPFRDQIPTEATREEYQKGVKLITEMMSSTGITSAHDAYGTPEDLRAYQDAKDAGELSLRVYALLGYEHLGDLIQAGVRTGLGDEWIRVGPVKLICDGSISERTARLSEPYVGRSDDFGILVMEEEELYEYVRTAHAEGWQIGVHANGDVAIDITLRVYERVQRESPRLDPRFRLEHCTVINDSLLSRIQALGAIPNPFSTYVYYHGEKMKEYGTDRLNSMFAVRSFLDAGIMATQCSDYPPGPFEPMMALQSSVTRMDMNGKVWGPAQRITIEEALRVGTLHGAYASFEEHLKGSIEPGKLADLVVLDKDPTRVDPFSLVEVAVERTMVGGSWVFEA